MCGPKWIWPTTKKNQGFHFNVGLICNIQNPISIFFEFDQQQKETKNWSFDTPPNSLK
jgi:hypothetical protein